MSNYPYNLAVTTTECLRCRQERDLDNLVPLALIAHLHGCTDEEVTRAEGFGICRGCITTKETKLLKRGEP